MPNIYDCMSLVSEVLHQQGFSALLGFFGWSLTLVFSMAFIYWIVGLIFPKGGR